MPFPADRAAAFIIFLTGVVRGAPGAAPQEQMPAVAPSDGFEPVGPLFDLTPDLPRTMNFQGELALKSSGSAPSGKYNMRFAMYDAATGGNKNWPSAVAYEEHAQVDLANGLFNVLLGSQNQPLAYTHFAISSKELPKDPYLLIWVCKTASQSPWTDYDEMDPRQPITIVGYSFLSEFSFSSGKAGIAQLADKATLADRATTLAHGADVDGTSSIGVDVSTSNSNDLATAIRGVANSSSGATVGLRGRSESESDGAIGVWGDAGKSNGAGIGVLGQTFSDSDKSVGVKGTATKGIGGVFEGEQFGVTGKANAAISIGVSGTGAIGVLGESQGSNPIAGVSGSSDTTAGTAPGVSGITTSPSDGATGVKGEATNEGKVYGVWGNTGSNTDGSAGVLGTASGSVGDAAGVMGAQGDGKYGVYSDGDADVEGNLTWKAKTDYVSIPGSAFVPAARALAVYNVEISGSITHEGIWVIKSLDGNAALGYDFDTGGIYYAPVSLPHGATISRLMATWQDFNAQEATLSLWTQQLTPSHSTINMANVLTSGTSGAISSSQTTSISQAKVDNSKYSYTLRLAFPSHGNPAKPIKFYGVVIEYTYTEP